MSDADVNIDNLPLWSTIQTSTAGDDTATALSNDIAQSNTTLPPINVPSLDLPSIEAPSFDLPSVSSPNIPQSNLIPTFPSKYDIGAPIDNLTVEQYNKYKDVLAGAGISITDKERVYSVFFTAGVGGGRSRSAHRRAANIELYRAMKSNAAFKAQMDRLFGYDVVAYMESGRRYLRNPAKNMEWHHPVDDPAHVELLRKKDHRDPNLQKVLHPDKRGGYNRHY